jgi:predicted O-linked N-acetylglucosamine transferase (SPINDLY family)
MGARFIDYIIADRFVLPRDHQAFYSEQPVYLPDCFQVNDGQRPVTREIARRQESGLPEHGFVFCCFNNNYKIMPPVFDVWMRLLRAVEDSVLWLSASNRTAADNLRREAETRGVAADRILFAPIVPQADYLAQYRCADLFLDTLPYNAGATASDALWSGCPVITCAGKTFVSRMAGSILHAANLPDLVTHSLSDYEALALRLARNPDELAAVKKRLAENIGSAPLFDCARFTRHLESAYQGMWETHLAGRQPAPIEVPASYL